MKKKWYETAYRRNVIDVHIQDWDESFLSQFDAREYVEMLTLAQVQSAVVYAESHVGHHHYPTATGHAHRGLRGRDVVSEVLDLCHQNGIHVVVYYSVIFDGWAYRQNPDWRIKRSDGTGVAEHSRYGVCCPNSPYRDYVVAHVEEICNRFDFEGIRFDMTFWPTVCYCRHCQRRYAHEVGGELPEVINWEDPRWVGFQRKREEWLTEFATLATETVKSIRPDVSVEHQAATSAGSWIRGVTWGMARQSDFLQGDFYGDALQGSFVRKLLRNLSENLPVGFETSSCVHVRNHTAIKSAELLEAKAHAALADAAAFVFIDGIDPLGTLNPAVYRRMGEVFSKTKQYEPYLGGRPCEDVAVYLSTESKCDVADNGKDVDDPTLSTSAPHVDAAVAVCRALLDHHIPYGVITKKNLAELSRHRVLVLPNVLMIDEEEVQAFREYVRSGGALYASRYTSLLTKDGIRKVDFLLSDVFGVSCVGETRERYTYVAPETGWGETFCGYTQRHPLGLNSSQMVVVAHPDTEILARTVLPYTMPPIWSNSSLSSSDVLRLNLPAHVDDTRYASIHSNPPGVNTHHPAVVLHRFGEGKAIYVTGDLERDAIHGDTFVNLVRLLADRFSFEADAPKSVEITVFHQEEGRRSIINAINFQKELPNVPVDGARVRLRLDAKKPSQLGVVPDGQRLDFDVRDGYVEFTVPRLETFAMFELEYA